MEMNKRNGAMECIDEMLMIFGKDVVKHYCLCRAWEYRYNATGEEDIRKSDWCMKVLRKLTFEENIGIPIDVTEASEEAVEAPPIPEILQQMMSGQPVEDAEVVEVAEDAEG